jgi:hypothetical protein
MYDSILFLEALSARLLFFFLATPAFEHVNQVVDLQRWLAIYTSIMGRQ